MFEHAGEFEIIRESDIPIFGSCAGHQMLVMQACITFARYTGRSFWTGEDGIKFSLKQLLNGDIGVIKVLKKDPIFDGITNPFFGQEAHSFNDTVIPEGWEVLAASVDSQGYVVNEVIKYTADKNKIIYGTQFHPERPQPWSGSAKAVLMNFLRMAVERAEGGSGNPLENEHEVDAPRTFDEWIWRSR
jgi:anthranilate/para-aminobenzoate synthase component II